MTIGTAAPERRPRFVRDHNRWVARLRRRDRLRQGVVGLVLPAGAGLSSAGGDAFAGGRTLGMVAFLACVLLLVIWCIAVSP